MIFALIYWYDSIFEICFTSNADSKEEFLCKASLNTELQERYRDDYNSLVEKGYFEGSIENYLKYYFRYDDYMSVISYESEDNIGEEN